MSKKEELYKKYIEESKLEEKKTSEKTAVIRKPTFFRDEGEIGNVLKEAKRIKNETKKLEETIESEKKTIEEFKKLIEEIRYRECFTQGLDEELKTLRSQLSDLINQWRAKEEDFKQKEEKYEEQYRELNKQKEELEVKLISLEEEQKRLIEKCKGEIDEKIQEKEQEQKRRLDEEIARISKISTDVGDELQKLIKTREAINAILSEEGEKIKDSIISREDIEFLRLNYFNLMKARLSMEGAVNPISGRYHSPDDWKIEALDNEIIATTYTTMLLGKPSVRFSIKFIIPEVEEGFIYKKAGKEFFDLISRFMGREKDRDAYYILTLVSPTGWTEWMINCIQTLMERNSSVYLVDLNERKLYYNENDKKTDKFASWFKPIPIEEEINSLIEKIKSDIEKGELQFRADKASRKYQASRRVVIRAFEELVELGFGELLGIEDGAKDFIFLVER